MDVKIYIIQSISFDHNGMSLKNTSRKITGNLKVGRNQTLLNNQWIKEEITTKSENIGE
jgi:hypothetical protein